MDLTLQRIESLMKEQGIQYQEMIEYLGLPRGAFSNWKRGMGKSYYEHIAAIADRLGVTIDYLVRGEELSVDSLSHNERELIENYRSLDDERKKIISKNLEFVAGK